MQSSFPPSSRSLLREHHLLTVGAHGNVFLATPEHCRNYSIRSQSLANFESQDASRDLPRRTEFQRVLRSVFLLLTLVTGRRHLAPNLEQVLAKHSVAGEHLRVVLNVSGTPPRSLHSSQLGSTARTARCGRTVSSSMSIERQRSQISSFASSWTSTDVGVASPLAIRALRRSYTRRSARACSSNGGDAANTVAAA